MESKEIVDRFKVAQNSLVIQQSDFSLAAIHDMVSHGAIDVSPHAALMTSPGGVEPFHTAPIEIANPKTGALAIISVAKRGLSVGIQGPGVSLAELEASLRLLLKA